MDFHSLLQDQRDYFATGITRPINFRLEQLYKLKAIINEHEHLIIEALHADLRRTRQESVIIELMLITEEIDFIIKNLKKWARPQKAHTPFPQLFRGKSKIMFEPYGCALIIAPWNYPFLLSLSPLVGAICAGNCAIIKPSELSAYSQHVIAELINRYFPFEFISVVKGGPEEVSTLLQEQFDYIFFTGSANVGKIVMEAAAKNLTPVTMELGGKSPCIIDETANLEYAAKRIIWGKMINAGQTCIAPDYLYVHQSVKEKLTTALLKTLKDFYDDDPAMNGFDRIINKRHFDRISHFLQKGNILTGGKINSDDLYIAPTIIDDISWDDPIMQEEIFGPLLPILSYQSLDEVVNAVNSRDKPLALYIFTRNKKTEAELLDRISFGGGCINDCIMQIANVNLPFGGVGTSGIGSYHGRFSFETFSHRKAIYKRSPMITTGLEYPPFKESKLKWIKRLLKL